MVIAAIDVGFTATGYAEFEHGQNGWVIRKTAAITTESNVKRRHLLVADDNARLHLELQAANEQLEALLEDRKRQLVVGQLSLNFAHETLASLPVAVLGVDNEGMIALANDAAMALFPGVMIGDFFVQAMPAAMHALQAHPCPYRGPCQVDGKPFQVAINPLGSPKKVRGRVISFIDCAEQEAPK